MNPATAQCYNCADVVLEGTLDDEGWCEECVYLPTAPPTLPDPKSPGLYSALLLAELRDRLPRPVRVLLRSLPGYATYSLTDL